MMASQDTEDSADAHPFDNLRKFDTADIPEPIDSVVQQKLPEPSMQLSRPQYISDLPIPEVPPPLSMSYKVFYVKFQELEKAGMVDGTGEWQDPG
ncbi:hypothetical protein SCP_0604310 [Sparassis crispa]|uniref:Uncharacterized protein n=1 Tax=Sparassis crispa TaxID=139825 RepID=A0A401GQH0_9APHY|nr:hypothetical protein SCP_0604310 [Sparassis crispa]GBE84452.1 hypothetical protein SCP_0604310 [Sparassis crispa]